MNLNDMEVYIYSIYNIINKLRGQIKFDFSLNDDKNICLEIVDSKIADIKPRDFIIKFDKNLGNFTIIKNIELEDLDSSVEYYYSGQRVLGKELQRIECYLKRLEKMKDIGK